MVGEQDLALALEKLRGEVALSREQAHLGFQGVRQEIKGLRQNQDEQQTHCRLCELTLREEIKGVEREARQREDKLGERLTGLLDALEERVRSLEISRGWLLGLVGLAGGLAGSLLGPLATAIIGRMMP